MVMRSVIQEWIAQWLGLRDRLRHPQAEPDGWWLGIRERILRFLVSRYVHDDHLADGVASDASRRTPPPIPIEHRRTYCRVSPEYRPPRTCCDMQGKLRSVSRINATKRRRWRLL
ncbi:MAG TPA: hypothetical protein PKE29_07040 [Phycisphaerales bacterium]|nr:hypothetical protein [Phycisphaerales bacterium]